MIPRLARLLLAALLLATQAHAEPTFPGFQAVRDTWQSSEIRLLDHRGRPLQELRADPGPRRGDWTALEAVSPAFIAALLLAEDRRFFEHAGVDWLAAGKAALGNWLAASPRGASTLGMQLVALLDPRYRGQAGRRNVGEKWLQMQGALALEKTWTKREILEAYDYRAGFGGVLTGIDAAARGLFDKRPAGLSTSESLLLASLIRAPNAKSAEVAKRACALAGQLPGGPDCASLGRLARQSLDGRHPILPASNLAPHLANRLLREREPTAAPGALVTTLDADLQEFVLATLHEQLVRLAGRQVQDAAALVVDNASGQILAYATASAPDSGSPLSDGVTARRQAGSTLKPFLYGLALEHGLLTPASALDDSPLTIATPGGEYAPQNYDRGHRGLVSLRTALAGSLNVPAVRTLQLVGLEAFADRLARFGFRGLTEAADFYGYALALGSLDVSLEELVGAYRALARGGLGGHLRFTPASPAARSQRVTSRESAFLVADILADRQARATTFGLENPLATRGWSAVKTGTSKDMRDNWCIGFSDRHTVGVWVGNFSGLPMHDVSGISGAAPAWAAIMDRLQAGLPARPPTPPSGLERRWVAPPGEPRREEWFLAGSGPPGLAWAAAQPVAEILRPGDGDILALDPDLPADRQRVSFQARGAPAAAWWSLDGVRQADTDWFPTRGPHELLLFSPGGEVMDQVRFEVR